MQTTYKSYYGICAVNRDIHKIRKAFHCTPCILIKWMRIFKSNEKSTLGFRFALGSSDFGFFLCFFFFFFSFLFFLGEESKGLFGPLFDLFYWHIFLISCKGAHLRDLFQGLRLPLFGLWAHDQILGWFNWPILGTLWNFWAHLKKMFHHNLLDGTFEKKLKLFWKTLLNPINLDISNHNPDYKVILGFELWFN